MQQAQMDSEKHVIRWVSIYSLMRNLFLKVRTFCGFVFKYIVVKDVPDDAIDFAITNKNSFRAEFWATGISSE